MQGKKENVYIAEMNYKNWLQVIFEKRILCQSITSITVLIKTRRIILKSFLNLTARMNFVFIPRFRKQKPLVSWFSG